MMRSGFFKNSAFDDMKRQLFKAVEEGELGEVSGLLEKCPSLLEVRDHFNDTPLIAAVRHQQLLVMRFLLAQKANTQAENYYQVPLLFLALEENNGEIVDTLLKAGVDCNQSANNPIGCISVDKNDTPLTFAIRLKLSDKIIQLLLSSGAQVNPPVATSPLHLACAIDNVEQVKLLLDKGANIDALNSENETSLHVAVNHNIKTVAAMLLVRHAKKEEYNKYGKAPIHYASDPDMLMLLLDHGCDVNLPHGPSEFSAHKIYHRKTKLHLSINNKDMVEFLLAHGAAVEACDANGNTVMHQACDTFKPEIFSLLLPKYQYLLSARNAQGRTPLMVYVSNSSYQNQYGHLLLNYDHDYSLLDNEGNTILHLAAQNSLINNEFVIQLIQKSRIAINAITKAGDTALHIAMDKHEFKVVAALLAEHADVNIVNAMGNLPLQTLIDSRLSFTMSDQIDALGVQLLPKIHKLDHTNQKQEMLLHGFAKLGCINSLKLLLTLKPDMQIDALTQSATTAAFLALANGHLDTFELLVQKGASVDLVKSICNKESKDGDIAAAKCKLKLCYPDNDEDKQFAIRIALMAIAFSRWSQPALAHYAEYAASIQHLIQKFGATNFTAACKENFLRDLNAMDLTNIKEYGPHTDINPYSAAYMRVANFIIAKKYLLCKNMLDCGYYVNIKTLFGDLDFWKIIHDQHAAVYADLIAAVKSWPEEIDSQSMYHSKKFNPLTLFREQFSEAYTFVQADLTVLQTNEYGTRKFC